MLDQLSNQNCYRRVFESRGAFQIAKPLNVSIKNAVTIVFFIYKGDTDLYMVTS